MGKYKRVRYNKSTLIEVIFQLRFPTILSINSNQPVVFQDKIRELYPFFEEQLEEQGNIVYDHQLQAPDIRKISENKNYSFISSDAQTKINLTPSFIAFSTKRYEQWENFKERIDSVLPLFEQIYKPAFYTRIGLRYINAITRSKLNLQDKKWTDLLQSPVIGMIKTEHEKGVKSYISEMEYETSEQNILSKAHFELVHVNDQEELSFLIDCDYYTIGINQTEQVEEISEKLHSASSHFIQSAISTELHEAMQPVEI